MPGPPPPLALAAAVRRDLPDPTDAALVVVLKGGIVIVGPITTVEAPAPNATVATVAANVMTVVLLALNPNRRAAAIFNHSVNRVLYVKLGPVASTVDFTERLMPLSHYELPFPVYSGIVTGVWSAGAGGSAQVTEIT